MKQSPSSLWQAISVLANQVPFTKAKVEAALPVRLAETDDAGNDVFQFWKSNPVSLSDGSVIANIDLRLKRQGSHPGFMAWEIGGTCVTLDQVRHHYGDLKITGVPRGRSVNEKTHYTASLPWGDLSFGFAESNPTCLASISFDPKKD